MTSKMFLDIVGVITTSKLNILSTFQGGLREPTPPCQVGLKVINMIAAKLQSTKLQFYNPLHICGSTSPIYLCVEQKVNYVCNFLSFQVADRLGLVTQQTRGHSLNNCHRSTAATPTQGKSRGAGGSDATKDNKNDNDDDYVEKHGISNDNESLCISDFSTMVQNNCNEFFNISKENDQLKTELKSYKDLCSKQVIYNHLNLIFFSRM